MKQQLFSTTPTPNLTTTSNYDSVGAIQYIIIVICVYAIGIFFFIMSHVRKHHSTDEDKEVGNFLLNAKDVTRVEEINRREHLQRTVQPYRERLLHKASKICQTDHEYIDDDSQYGSQDFPSIFPAEGLSLAEEVISGSMYESRSQQISEVEATSKSSRDEGGVEEDDDDVDLDVDGEDEDDVDIWTVEPPVCTCGVWETQSRCTTKTAMSTLRRNGFNNKKVQCNLGKARLPHRETCDIRMNSTGKVYRRVSRAAEDYDNQVPSSSTEVASAIPKHNTYSYDADQPGTSGTTRFNTLDTGIELRSLSTEDMGDRTDYYVPKFKSRSHQGGSVLLRDEDCDDEDVWVKRI